MPRRKIGLVICIDYGQGVDEDDKEAAKWYHKAAEQGNALAQRLGHTYNYGWGVDEDANQAAKWYRKAAEQGDAAPRNFILMNSLKVSDATKTNHLKAV